MLGGKNCGQEASGVGGELWQGQACVFGEQVPLDGGPPQCFSVTPMPGWYWVFRTGEAGYFRLGSGNTVSPEGRLVKKNGVLLYFLKMAGSPLPLLEAGGDFSPVFAVRTP